MENIVLLFSSVVSSFSLAKQLWLYFQTFMLNDGMNGYFFILFFYVGM